MRNRYLHTSPANQFTDLASCQFFRPPDQIVKAGALTYREIIESSDLYLPSTGEAGCRPVIFEDSDGVKWYLELTPYLHPSGAADVTLGTLAFSATGVGTYTPTLEGVGLDEDGTIIDSDSSHTPLTMAGWLFTDYFTHIDDNVESHENFRATKIEEGDFLWLIRRGRWEIKSEEAIVTDGAMLIISNTAGEVEEADAIDTGGTVAAYNTSLARNTVSNGSSHGLAVARAVDTGAANLVVAELLLPPRFSR